MIATEDTHIQNLENLGDHQLFLLVAAKERNHVLASKAYDVLYNRYARLIWTLCYKVGGRLVRWNKDLFIEELFSRTITKIFEYPTYDPTKGKISTWMSRIAQNIASDLLKEREDYRLTTVVPVPEQTTEEEESVFISEEHRILQVGLDTLTDREKDVLLTYIEHEKHLPRGVLQELCERQRLTADNARQIKSRAMKKLQQRIQQLQWTNDRQDGKEASNR